MRIISPKLNLWLSESLEKHAEDILKVVLPIGFIVVVLFFAWLSVRVG